MVISIEEKQFIDCPHWPQFFILGTQKAGTTSLFYALVQHPNICAARIKDNESVSSAKEVHYFDVQSRWEKGPEFYCSKFVGCDNHNNNKENYDLVRNTKSVTTQSINLHLDSTPGYLDIGIAKRMAQTFSPSARNKMKFIVVLREPVERMLSWYNHVLSYHKNNECPPDHFLCNILRRKTFKDIPCDSGLGKRSTMIAQGNDLEELLSFGEFVLCDKLTVRKSKYVDILKEYYNVFGMENILVLNFNFMMKRQKRTMTLISEFLGIDNLWVPNFSLPKSNDMGFDGKLMLENVDCGVVEELENFYKPYNEELYALLRNNKNGSWDGQPYFQRFQKPPCKKG